MSRIDDRNVVHGDRVDQCWPSNTRKITRRFLRGNQSNLNGVGWRRTGVLHVDVLRSRRVQIGHDQFERLVGLRMNTGLIQRVQIPNERTEKGEGQSADDFDVLNASVSVLMKCGQADAFEGVISRRRESIPAVETLSSAYQQSTFVRPSTYAHPSERRNIILAHPSCACLSTVKDRIEIGDLQTSNSSTSGQSSHDLNLPPARTSFATIVLGQLEGTCGGCRRFARE